MADKVLFKKYGNRRLYDTERNAYVTLNQVADTIKEGRDVEIIDAKTKEDVTSYVLTQIVLEEAKKRNVLLPAPLLKLIIRYGEGPLGEFFDNYLQQSMRNFILYKSAMDENFRKWLDMSGTAKAFTDMAPFPSFMDIFSGGARDKKKDKEE